MTPPTEERISAAGELPLLAELRAFVAHLGDAARDAAIKLADSLRREGIGAIEAIGEKSLKSQLRQANGLGAAHTIIIGEEEIKAGVVVLRDMAGASQQTVTPEQLKDLLK